MSLPGNRRIAVFFPTCGGGGAERAMLLFAEGAADAGCRVDIVVCDSRGPLSALIPDNVRLVSLDCGRMRRAFFPLLRYLRRERPKALYSTLPHANLLAIAACRMTGTCVVVRQATSHLTATPKGVADAIAGNLIPWCYAMADGVIAVSKGVREQLHSVNQNLPVHVLPNPIMTPQFESLACEPVEHPWFHVKQPPVILAAARLTRHKGLHMLLEAFSKVREDNDARLVVLGDGPERSSLIELSKRLGVSDDVSFPGFVHNPLPFMRNAGVFVLSSEFEGMPNVLLQAMACGTPVVSTDCDSGPREILDNGRLGELVPVGNKQEMARAIRTVLSRKSRPQQGSQFVKENFSLDKTVRGYLSLIGLDAQPSMA